MIAADTSSFIAYFNGEAGQDVERIDRALEDESLFLPPVGVAELLSAKQISEHTRKRITEHPLLPLKTGYWERTGTHRRTILKAGKKANLADSMIATFCIDYQMILISRDRDYRHFSKFFGLSLLYE